MRQEFNRYELPDMAGKKVLITGGLGFIGSNLVRACVEQGAQVTVYDNLDPGAGGNLRNVKDVAEQISIVVNDIRNYVALAEVVKGHDYLWHCAANTSHAISMQDPRFDVDVNCHGVINVLEAVRNNNPKMKVVYIGTSTQIGVMNSDSIDEAQVEFPLDIYSANKGVGEKYSLIYHTAYGLKTSVVRLVNIFGPRAHIATSNSCFINYFMGLALQQKNISIYGDGKQLRSLLYVADAVEALIRVGVAKKSVGKVYFASGDKQYSVVEIAKEIVSEIGGELKMVAWPDDRRAIEPGNAIVKHGKITRELGWLPRIGFQEGLRLTKEYYGDCLEEYIQPEERAVAESV